MVRTGFLIASLFTLALGKPVSRSLHVHERRDAAPQGYTLTAPASPDTVLNLRIALAQNDPDGLIKALYDVSTPSSPTYGHHLSKDEVNQYVAPKPETVTAVNSWLNENNINASTISPAGDWLSFSVPVSQANDMLDADFAVYTHDASGAQMIRTLSYSIPSTLQGYVDLVHPTTTFTSGSSKLPVKVSKLTVPPKGSKRQSSSDVDPSTLQSLYGIPSTPATQSSNAIGVTGYDEEYANQADLALFLENYRTDISSSTTFTVSELDGGSNDQNQADAGYEANLDTQYTVGIATGVPVVFLSVGDDSSDGLFGFLDTANYFLNEDSPPQVITTSYGSNENEISTNLAFSLCNAYAQLGARGVSVLFASGDGGVSGSQSSSCTNFVPTFPSGCPYLTSVGATQGSGPETAADFSSGGFSNYWGVPDYQSSAVSSFLSNLGSTNSGLYNSSGRGFPDVSAQGVSFIVAEDAEFWLLDGTSCASPTFASVIALINDKLIAAGKSTLGFLNPLLYSNPSALNDITSGDNPGCSTNGFNATGGWDPVTGLGTPNFAALSSLAGV
ncbi:hypothetical protein AcW1_005225 [Taiwanofungus camphoratus]|nr:hypothetical protein AcW2_003995 [Antrodia cinnamomea]KAI0956581.1 hypothetical protein AcW1_005225 [Antrodia cinnamomea]